MATTASRRCWQYLMIAAAAHGLAIIALAAVADAEDAPPRLNLAVVATPSTSFVSGHETLTAINDGYDPENSQDVRHGEYGNWPQSGTQWVQLQWSQPISTREVEVYWWNDHRGVRMPTACRLLYWDGSAFVPVSHPHGLGLAENQYNVTTFDEVTTTQLRLEMDSEGTFSTGILEWRVLDSGKSPDFPPIVSAGVDRVVIRGGTTYLNGRAQSLLRGGVQVPLEWSKVSGPGAVTFADAAAPHTTATFSQAGAYVLTLTAGTPPLATSAELRVQVADPPSVPALEPLEVQPYTIHSPLWTRRAKALIVHWIPHCIRTISRPDLKEGGIANFVDAANKLAGKPVEPSLQYPFSNAWVYNTIEAACIAQMVDPQGDQEIIEAQASMHAALEDWIPKILAAQEPDGYLQTAFTLNGNERWAPQHRGDHEGYVAGYFLDAAVAHYVLTKGADDRLYRAARRLADCWEANIGPPPKKAWYDGHQALEMALVRFARLVNRVEGEGQGDRYIALAKFLLDNRRDGSEYDQSHVPVTQQYEAVGHAVRAVYSYAAMTDIATATRDVDYLSAVLSLWNNLINAKYYVTGGVGSGETSEGFGPNYSLRHNAYCESCSSCGEIFFQHRMNLLEHDAKYVDLYEQTLYNALLGSMDLEGKNFYYDNSLDCGHRRYDWHVCPCCVGNIPRTLLSLPTWMYAKDRDGICVNLFVGSTVNVEGVAGTDVEMVQKTDYPWNGKVSLTIHPATSKEFSVKVRVPRHDISELYHSTPNADGITTIAVNGQPVDPPRVNGYAVITRQWQAGDTIDLELPLKVQRVKGIDKIEATRGRVALRFGPLIYSLENVDQPLGPESVLPPAAELRPEWQEHLLDGVMVIKGAWADGTPLLAIPNFARHNRYEESTPRPSSGANRRRGGGEVRSQVWVRDE
ncbi:MAG: glycoside hydrolase family 127 protein [Pirellulaceae bacterium]